MAVSQKYSYYEILEIHPSAAAHEVTAAYKRAKETYSGLDPAIYTIFTEQEARELSKMIEEAYAVLGHRQLRIRYDKKIASRGFKDESELSYSSLLKENSEDLAHTETTLIPSFKVNADLEKKFKEKQDWDGESLKEVREYKQLTLKDLHTITKVNAYYINNIEKMTPAELPAEVFVRGYVHQVSRALGLNDKIVVESYMKKYRSLVGQQAQK